MSDRGIVPAAWCRGAGTQAGQEDDTEAHRNVPPHVAFDPFHRVALTAIGPTGA